MKMKVQNMMLPVFLFVSLFPISSIAQGTETKESTSSNLTSLASSNKKSSATYHLETFGSLASGENTPFWMQQHKWGIVPLETKNYYLRAGAAYRQKINRNVSFDLGVDLVTASKQANMDSFWLQQAYGKINWKALQMSVGMTEDYRSVIVDPYLSLGDIAYSNNARPNPEIRIGIPHFTVVPYTKNILYIKGDFSVGKFIDNSYIEKIAQATNQSYTTGVLSHSKSLHLRIGNIERKETATQVTIGIDHYAQWGGKMYRKDGEIFNIGNNLKKFINVLTFRGNTIKDESTSGTVATFSENSHFASLNFRLDFGRYYGEEIYSIYYQHPAENKAGIKFENSSDMLLGIQYKSQYPKLISNVILEYFYTKDQNASLKEEDKLDNSNSGLNNYYNSQLFFQGRSHFGMTLGSSIFLSPRFNTDGKLGFKSNRIFALHGALEGYLTSQIKYSLLGTFGESLGTYPDPYTAKEQGFAGMANISYLFRKSSGLSITCTGAFNTGHFFESKSYGGGITVRKTGKLF